MTENSEKNKIHYDEIFLRVTSMFFIIGVVVADYMGFTSQYSNFILGSSVTVYVFGKKGLIILISKFTGYKINELDDFLNK